MKTLKPLKSILFGVVVLLLGTSLSYAQNYCSSSANSTKYGYINEVSLGGNVNSTGNNGGYGDFTSQSVNVTSGASYTLQLEPRNRWPFYYNKNRWRVWADYNQDGDFSDPGELVLSTRARGTVNANVMVPAGFSGSTRVRISMSLFNNPNACSHFSYGEVEDYTITAGQCLADAGTITADADTVCATAAGVTITATPDNNAFVPTGFSTVYVLTSGPGLVIEQAGATPSFTVSDGGNYTIHTLIYDPNTLDLSTIVFGTTTGVDVNGLLVQGGGTICASLDVAGAPVVVESPWAGTLYPNNFISCINNGNSTLTANSGGNAQIPAGYSEIYVLTSGQGLVIEQAGANPTFTVNATGIYRIHRLVYNPATLDLGIVVFGTTTGFDVNSLLVQGGGHICASLDVTGAPFLVFGDFICSWFYGHRTDLNYLTSVPADYAYDEILTQYDSYRNSSVKEELTVSIYPNPSQDFVNIDLTGVSTNNLELSLYNTFGQLVKESRYNVLKSDVIQLDLEDLASGIYILQLTDGTNTSVSRIEKK